MNMQISAKHLTVNPTLLDIIERRLHFALGRFSGTIHSVAVNMRDENGPRGGVDKACRIIVKIRGVEDVIVEGRGHSLQAVVNRTADRAGRAVARAIALRRKKPVVRASGEMRGRRTSSGLADQ